MSAPLARAQGQRVSGTVRDATTGSPVGAAVVWLANGADSALRRVLTDGEGRYVLARHPDASTLHVVRIGFRPFARALAASDSVVNVQLSALPPMLASVAITGDRVCPDDGRQGRALALWTQARAALLASVVARETRPARI